MKRHKVYILSDAIRTGKTTALQQWVEKTKSVTGFLSPDIDGKRMFLDIQTGKLIPMETSNKDLIVGKYAFDTNSFKYAENKLLEAWKTGVDEYIVIDEIGPLEIRKNLGFHNLLLQLQPEANRDYPNLFFVVRDYCLDEFIEKYGYQEAEVLSLKAFRAKLDIEN